MALYDFENIDTGEVRELFFKMNDLKEYNGEDGTEVGKWRRKFHVPLAAIDTQLDAFSKEQFVRRTEKYSTVGDHMAKSQELSEIRAQKGGRDEVKQKFFDDYAATRKGQRHFAEKPQKFENDRVSIDFTAKD